VDFAKGCLNGCLLALPFWGLVALIVIILIVKG
jgi:hypothetical protein